jgi:maltooligosyltrehalose trehalohydrolase
VMERDEARIAINFGKEPYSLGLLEGERLDLVSREGIDVRDGAVELPPMTMAVLLSSSEAVQNRQVEAPSH